jgi:proline iminopeptidase
MQHGAFMDDDALIRNIAKIRHLPAVIVQGRYDVICPPVSAYRLHQAWPEAAYHVIGDAGRRDGAGDCLCAGAGHRRFQNAAPVFLSPATSVVFVH